MDTKKKGMEVYILLDRTGSMSSIWDEAVSSINAYVRGLAEDGADDRITLAAFDAYGDGMQFEVLRDAVPIDIWEDFGNEEVLPRGMTPLLDALMKIVTMAEEADNEKTAIVVMTDGHENASREVSKEAARSAIERVKDKKWQVNFLGANFDSFNQAGHLGVPHANVMNFYIGRAESAMSSTARVHSQYRGNISAVPYRKEDRKDAREDEVGKS